MAEKGKIAIKKWHFRGKKRVIQHEKLRAGNQNRKAKRCKMQVLFLKVDKVWGVKSQKKCFFTYFMTDFLARTELKKECCCKIKLTDLRFWVDEAVSWGGCKLRSWWVRKLRSFWVCELMSLSTCELVNSSTGQLVNRLTRQLLNSSTCQPLNMLTG